MRRDLSRRDFLKLSGVGLAGLGALAFNRFNTYDFETLSAPKRLPQFPNSPIIGRTVKLQPASPPGI